jgi:hypothetical protein
MSPLEELETVERVIARLRRRIQHQAMHVEGLADYPHLAKRASAILVQETESLRKALVQLEEVKKLVAKETAEAEGKQPAKKSGLA